MVRKNLTHVRIYASTDFGVVTFAGGAIERWEDKVFRTCFADILSGNWRQHDPYDLDGRINAKSSMYGRANQVSPSILLSLPCSLRLPFWHSRCCLVVEYFQDLSRMACIQV